MKVICENGVLKEREECECAEEEDDDEGKFCHTCTGTSIARIDTASLIANKARSIFMIDQRSR